MGQKFRKTGIDIIGDVPWGTHLCQFYQTKEDLIDILVPYFKAGLENNEFCIWITSEPLGEKRAQKAMRKAVSNFDRYLKRGQIEIVSHTKWYLKDGAFRLQRVLNAGIDKLNQALAKGYDGMRITGNTAWLGKRDWRNFTDYEEEVNNVIGKHRIIAICTYSLNRCRAVELIDVVSNHQFTLVRREDRWDLIESSERKKAEEALRRSENLLSSVIDQSPFSTWIADANGTNIRQNAACRKLFGIDYDKQTVGKYNVFRDPVIKEQGHLEKIKKVFKEGKAARFTIDYDFSKVKHVNVPDATHRLLDVTIFPITDANGRVVNAVVQHEDITERKKAEQKIEVLSRFPSENPNPVLRIATDGTVLYANDAGKKIFKAKVGKKMSDHYLPILKKAISSEQYVNFEEQIGHRYFSTVVKPILKAGYFNIYSIDITERKKAEEVLIRSEKLKALGEMAAGVAHDFNNLLAIILGNAQLLERGLERYKSEEIKHRLKVIARTASEGGKTVRRLQHFTRKEILSQDFTKINLNDIIKEAISSTSPRWKDEAEAKGIRIKIKEKLGKLPSILGSRSELMEVLTNLIFNALEAMPEGGEITIRTEAKENKVYLYFTDSGQSIPDSIKEKIFDPFFTTKSPQASGLGLSVSYGIIRRHRGKIKVQSSKGKGTTFTISMSVRLESKKR